MITQTRGKLPVPESVWGVEALDHLAQHEWAGKLWERLTAHHFIRRPLLLLYSPSAERSAIRCLRALARIGRHEASTVFFSMPGDIPLLITTPSVAADLFLVHRASRFLNLSEWLSVRLVHPSCKVVMTCPIDELEAIAYHRYFDQERLPEEESDYCRHKAAEIITKYLPAGSSSAPGRNGIIPILAESGMAGVEIPLGLLARALDLDIENLATLLESEQLREFVRYADHGTIEDYTVTFKGRWLAESMATEAGAGFYPSLVSLLDHFAPAVRSHRLFALNLLVALRAQGDARRIFHEHSAQLSADYHDRLETARELAGARERLAWDLFRRHGWLKLIRIALYMVEKKLHLLSGHKELPLRAF
ncbi:MAG: hypothetical protein ACREOI_18930 [bacterium]